MGSILRITKGNLLSICIGLLFFIAFYYLTYSGVLFLNSDSDGNYNPRQAAVHGTSVHYYHK